MDEKLLEYIRKRVESGTDIEEIKQALLNVGHEISVVEEHINDALKEKKSKKRLKKLSAIVVVVILIVIIVTGFYYFYYHPISFNKKTALAINESGNAESQNQKNSELLNKALIKNDVSVCDEIAEQDLKDECKRKFSFNASNAALENVSEELKLSKELLNKALITHNPSLCIEIADNATRNACKQSFGNVTEDGK